MNCDFCAELSARPDTRFQSIYSGLLESRIALKANGFAALPTIGQLFEGSYLVIPTSHIEKYAQLPLSQRYKALEFVAEVEGQLRCYGPTAIYEHGSSSANQTGCGVYHAHIHIVPLPRESSAEDLLQLRYKSMPTLLDAWDAASMDPEYLALRDTYGQVALVTHETIGRPLGSQFMRKRLVELFELSASWDWREYRAPEPKLIRSARAI